MRQQGSNAVAVKRERIQSDKLHIRKSGNQVFYSVRDPIIIKVLELMRRYFYTHLQEAMDLLGEMDKAPTEVRP